MVDHDKACYILMITFLALAMLDALLTEHALTESYYETNPLTQKVGPFAHFGILTGTVALMYVFIPEVLPQAALTIILTALNLVWMFNNTYSITLLFF